MSNCTLIIAALLCASCATVRRWDAELKARNECRQRLCNEQGLALVSKEIPNTHLFSYYCCNEDKTYCEAAKDDCAVTL